MSDRERLRELLERATPGPWVAIQHRADVTAGCDDPGISICQEGCEESASKGHVAWLDTEECNAANAALICEMRNLLPSLLSETAAEPSPESGTDLGDELSRFVAWIESVAGRTVHHGMGFGPDDEKAAIAWVAPDGRMSRAIGAHFVHEYLEWRKQFAAPTTSSDSTEGPRRDV